jgi:four helix bundle protein
MNNTPVKTFFDLNAWQEGRKLTNAIYILTSKFPSEEKFGLVSQMRRASVSEIANIAEGFGRTSIKEKLQFYNQAHGSLTELHSHIIVAQDLKYLSIDESKQLFSHIQNTQALLQGLIRSTRKRL